MNRKSDSIGIKSNKLFFIANMSPSRPADYCLGYDEGSVYLDFDKTEDGRVYLRRISFDRYGCCELTTVITSMSDEDSFEFIKIVGNNISNQYRLMQIVQRTISNNSKYIWLDALEEYQLL